MNDMNGIEKESLSGESCPKRKTESMKERDFLQANKKAKSSDSSEIATAPFPLHHDCLLQALTYLPFDKVVQNKIACVCMAMVLDFVEFIDPRVENLLEWFPQHDYEHTQAKFCKKTVEQTLCSKWENNGPLLESIDEMNTKLGSLLRRTKNKAAKVFGKVERLKEGGLKFKLRNMLKWWLNDCR